MARFNHLKGVFGLLPTPYNDDYTIRTSDLRAVANFCCRSGQHGLVWPVMVGEFYYLGEEERISHLDAVLEEVNGRLPVVFGCSGVSVLQVLQFARAAQPVGADAIIATVNADSDLAHRHSWCTGRVVLLQQQVCNDNCTICSRRCCHKHRNSRWISLT